MHISLHLDDDVIPWELKNRGDFWLKVFGILGYNTSFGKISGN